MENGKNILGFKEAPFFILIEKLYYFLNLHLYNPTYISPGYYIGKLVPTWLGPEAECYKQTTI